MFDRETLKNLGDSQVTTTSIFDLQCEPITNSKDSDQILLLPAGTSLCCFRSVMYMYSVYKILLLLYLCHIHIAYIHVYMLRKLHHFEVLLN